MDTTFILPEPHFSSEVSIEQTLQKRCSRRHFTSTSLTQKEISQILWAAYGLRWKNTFAGSKTTPSAGALYPLEIYILIGKVDELPQGLYHYSPANHSIEQLHTRDLRDSLCFAAYHQEMIQTAPVTLVYMANFEKVTYRYGERGIIRYIPMDIGHSAQNVYLQAEAMGLGTCAVGAFDDGQVTEVLSLPDHLTPMYLMPVGHY